MCNIWLLKLCACIHSMKIKADLRPFQIWMVQMSQEC